MGLYIGVFLLARPSALDTSKPARSLRNDNTAELDLMLEIFIYSPEAFPPISQHPLQVLVINLHTLDKSIMNSEKGIRD